MSEHRDAAFWQQRSFFAGRIFTPTSPVDEKSLFAGRNEQLRAIIDVINQKGQHAVVYGERGVGKTSLANVLASFIGQQTILAPRVNCSTSDTFLDVWRKAFETIDLQRTQPGIGFTTPAKIEPFNSSHLLGSSPGPEDIRRALTVLSSQGLTIFIIDEFDRLLEAPRRAFADTIKALSDHAVNATVILVGVADNVVELLAEHQSVERALVQIQMPRMSAAEIQQIISTGCDKLGMTVTFQALRQIAKLAQGLPHYAHLLGLHAVRAALDSQSMELDVACVRNAIEKAIKGANQSIRNSYEVAVRSARKDNLFSDVLLACALAETSDLGYFAAQAVRNQLRMITGKQYEIPSFAQHLNEFCDDKRGPILQKTGSPRLFRYRFINPLMQPFVIMQGIQTKRISEVILDVEQ